jgi:hypothetical protein
MKRMHDNSNVIEFFVRLGLIAALAAALLAPMTVNVHGSDTASRVEHGWPMLKRSSWNALPLPPIPYIETMPWLVHERAPKGFKIDTLLAPKFEMSPAVAEPGSDAILSAIERSPNG